MNPARLTPHPKKLEDGNNMTTASDSAKYFTGWLLAFFLTVIGALLGSSGSTVRRCRFGDKWDEALRLFIKVVPGSPTFPAGCAR